MEYREVLIERLCRGDLPPRLDTLERPRVRLGLATRLRLGLRLRRRLSLSLGSSADLVVLGA